MLYVGHKITRSWPALCALLLIITISKVAGEEFDNRFLLGVYNDKTGHSLDETRHNELHLNFLFGVPTNVGSYDSFCSEDPRPQNAVYLYAAETDRLEPHAFTPQTLSEWKNETVDDALSRPMGNNSFIHRMSWGLGEEDPEFYDPLYYDAMNFLISEKIPSNELATFCGTFSFRPDVFLWVEGFDLPWLYFKPFLDRYKVGDQYYQDSLQKYCVDNYDRAAHQYSMYRKWGYNPNLQLSFELQGFYDNHGHRIPTPEEMSFEGWLAISRGAKGLMYYLYHGSDFIDPVEYSQVGLIKSDRSENSTFEPAADFFGKIKNLDNRLKNEYSCTNGLYDVDVVEFRSEQGGMTALGMVMSIEILDPPDRNQAYYEVASFISPTDNFFLLLNRTLHLPSVPSVTYRLQVTVPYPGQWRLVDLVTGLNYEVHDCGNSHYFYQNVTIPKGEAMFFGLKDAGASGGTNLITLFPEATAYSNSRKLAISSSDGNVYTCLAYTDGLPRNPPDLYMPYINYAVSRDFGITWNVWDPMISNAEYPSVVPISGSWFQIAYRRPSLNSNSSLMTYHIYDRTKGLEPHNPLTLRECKNGGSTPSMDVYVIDPTRYECHVVFYDKTSFQLCHYVVNQDYVITGLFDDHYLSSVGNCEPCVACDEDGNAYVFFDDGGQIYYWDGVSHDAMALPFYGKDPSASIEFGALLLTWISSTGTVQSKRGILGSQGTFTWIDGVIPEELGTSPCEQAQAMGSNAAVWEYQGETDPGIYRSVRDETFNPWDEPTLISAGSHYPQSAIDPRTFTYANAWTEGSTSPYTVGVNIATLDDPELSWGKVQLLSPNGGEVWSPGQKVTIAWSYSETNETNPTHWWIHLSTDGGNFFPDTHQTPDPLIVDGNLYIGGYEVPFALTTTARIKVRSWDTGNPTDYSDNDFCIGAAPLPPKNYPICGVQPPGSQKEIYWETYSASGMQGAGLEYSLDDGNSWNSEGMLFSGTIHPPSDSLAVNTFFGETDTTYYYMYWGTINWSIPNAPTSSAKIRLTAYDSLSNSSTSTQDESFVIPMPGGWAYNTSTNQDVWSLNDAGDKMGLFYTGFNYADSTKPIIYYTESADGYSLDIPDSIAIGTFPCHQDGEAFWLSTMKDTIYRSYWDEAIPYWSTPNVMFTGDPIVDSIRHSPIGIDIDADTVHIIFEKRICDDPGYDQLRLLHASLLRESSTLIGPDTIYTPITSGPQNSEAPSIQADAGDVYISYWKDGFCSFIERTPLGQFMFHQIGVGYQPTLSLSEGNIIYNYISSNSRSLIRLWRYRDDTVWAGCDTFTLNDEVDLLTSQHGILYSTQVADTTISRTYLYDPLGQRLIQRSTRNGSYPHSYLWKCSDDQWTECYTGYLDTFRFVKTETNDLNAFFPALYQEADHRRSPYTSYRDTCVEYDPGLVDYGADSLVYGFNRLDPTRSYRLLVEFYFESATADTIRILANLGGFTDTVEVPNNTFVWHAFDLPPGSGFNLHLYPLDLADYVTVSRLTVGQIDPSHLLMLCGAEEEEEIPISFCLFQPLPNPFTDFATIRYSIPYATRVKLKVYDVVGRQVAELVDGEVNPGIHTLTWEGRDDIGRRCASGIYFVYFTAEDYIGAKKVVLIK